MPFHYTCEHCQGNLGWGEKCDCTKSEKNEQPINFQEDDNTEEYTKDICTPCFSV